MTGSAYDGGFGDEATDALTAGPSPLSKIAFAPFGPAQAKVAAKTKITIVVKTFFNMMPSFGC
jgi:hypothetical protein